MTTFHNCYAFDRLGQRVVIDMGLPYHEAMQRCAYEAAFIESMGDALTRLGDCWYGAGMVPRIVAYDVRSDPFQSVYYEERRHKPEWLPDIAEL